MNKRIFFSWRGIPLSLLPFFALSHKVAALREPQMERNAALGHGFKTPQKPQPGRAKELWR